MHQASVPDRCIWGYLDIRQLQSVLNPLTFEESGCEIQFSCSLEITMKICLLQFENVAALIIYL